MNRARQWVFMALLSLWALGRAQTPGDLRQNLIAEIEALTREYGELHRLQSAVMNDLERLRVEERLVARQIALMELNLQETQARIQSLQARVDELQRERAGYERHLERRIAAMYRLGSAYPLKLLLSVSDARRVLQASAYAGAMARLDRVYVERYLQTVRALAQEIQDLQQSQVAYQQALEAVRQKYHRLAEVRRRRELYLEELQKRGDMYARALTELSLASRHLDDYVQDSDYRPLLDIRKFQGLLDWPVTGPVTRPFGRVRLPETGTYILSRGIEIAVPEGTPVRAVFGGLVRYAGWFTAYGKLIILDHGYDVYTLYAHNSVLKVRVGETVQKGQVIALSGSTASLRGPSVYFEIRLHAQAQNPMDWLKVLPGGLDVRTAVSQADEGRFSRYEMQDARGSVGSRPPGPRENGATAPSQTWQHSPDGLISESS
ncbi:MAG: peptidoglycan DD-metalloendopeptidase family protein [Acidobacteria bacterium]|nr:peptidoglycan DD-metalloendopeptidase family protein [Acidobacteriota bacterium]MDW7983472.1 peptidoglycan DD-metalloendopeptidase family protein [Acidobacteriota bacterium]